MKKTNTETAEQKEVAYEKGLDFEKQFAKFMKRELGWKKVRVGAHMQGKHNAKGTTIDVFAERLDYIGVKFNKIANRLLISAICFAIFSFIWHIEKWGEHGYWMLFCSLVSLAIVSFSKVISSHFNKQNAWVECKNLKSKVNFNHIHKMLREYNDYRASKNDDHKFTHLYFASANGYVENALKTAVDNKVICYVKKGDTFVEAKYWDDKIES